MPTLAHLLKQARDKAGLNQAEAAKSSGVSQGKISELEAGKINPTVATVQKLCECYGTTISKLTKGLE